MLRSAPRAGRFRGVFPRLARPLPHAGPKPLLSLLLVAASFLFASASARAQEGALTNEQCLGCHADASLTAERDGRQVSLFVEATKFAASVHESLRCVDCHTALKELPHAEKLAPVACGSCHEEVQQQYAASVHALRAGFKENQGATCRHCHGSPHAILPRRDAASPIAPDNLPNTCGACHSATGALREHTLQIPKTFKEYAATIHGQGLLRAGMLYAASCKDCHASHLVVPAGDLRSPIHRANVVNTCGRCHTGVRQQFLGSIHGGKLQAGDMAVPVCTQCHRGHQITEPARDEFQIKTVAECGTCHDKLFASYRQTYHGKVTALGYAGVAACSSCHTAHNVRPPGDPASSIAPANITSTCRQCHPAATARFAGFMVHPDYGDRGRYPLLYWVYHLMLAILTGTMVAFGAHTVLWYNRAWRERRKGGQRPAATSGEAFLRLSPFNRLLHMLVMSSFILLVITGIPLAFSHTQWAAAVFRSLGGYQVAALLHRFGALVTFLYVALHLAFIVWHGIIKRQRGFFWGPASMVVRLQDVRDFFAHLAWFFGRGPRPRFDRWTYWEKFDYYADLWGVLVFGSTGLLMWFPTFFTRFLPGVALNVSLIMHGIEALLAISFIFTIHFFNAHLRPGKFPMDPVIVTGRISREELEEERPKELARYLRDGTLELIRTTPAPPWLWRYAHVIGFVALAFGLSLIALIVASLLLG